MRRSLYRAASEVLQEAAPGVALRVGASRAVEEAVFEFPKEATSQGSEKAASDVLQEAVS